MTTAENGVNGTAILLESKLLHKDAKLPTRNRLTDAGYDLYSIEDAVVPAAHPPTLWESFKAWLTGEPLELANTMVTVHTGIAISCPAGHYYTIDGRSGLAIRGIMPFRGIIDSGYTGEILVILLNHSNKPYVIKKGDRVAQLITHNMIDVLFEQVDEFSPEYNTRGTKGFASSGR